MGNAGRCRMAIRSSPPGVPSGSNTITTATFPPRPPTAPLPEGEGRRVNAKPVANRPKFLHPAGKTTAGESRPRAGFPRLRTDSVKLQRSESLASKSGPTTNRTADYADAADRCEAGAHPRYPCYPRWNMLRPPFSPDAVARMSKRACHFGSRRRLPTPRTCQNRRSRRLARQESAIFPAIPQLARELLSAVLTCKHVIRSVNKRQEDDGQENGRRRGPPSARKVPRGRIPAFVLGSFWVRPGFALPWGTGRKHAKTAGKQGNRDNARK